MTNTNNSLLQRTRKLMKQGFTLAELLIVVAIIAVLVAVAIPVFSAQLLKAKQATTLANFRSAKAEAAAAFLLDEDVVYEEDWKCVEIPGVKCPLSYEELSDYLPTLVDELDITNGYAWSTNSFEPGAELYILFTINNDNGGWDIDINNEPYQ